MTEIERKIDKILELLADEGSSLEALGVQLKRNAAEIAEPSAAKEAKPTAQDVTLDFSKLFWEKKQGEKGEYEQTSEKANQNCDLWKQLKGKVKEHKGFWQNGGFKFWLHQQDENVIDRRKA